MTNNHPQPLLEIRRGVYSPSEIVRSKRFELQILLLEVTLPQQFLLLSDFRRGKARKSINSTHSQNFLYPIEIHSYI